MRQFLTRIDLKLITVIFVFSMLASATAGQTVPATARQVHSIAGFQWFSRSDLTEAYAERIRLQQPPEGKVTIGNCVRPKLTPNIKYRCQKETGELLPPYPLAIPITGDSIDLGYVPLSDVVNGESIVKAWFQKARSNPVITCNGERCLKLVEFVARNSRSSSAQSWVSVCSLYEFGTQESLPLDCYSIVLVFKDQTWVLVPGQCSECGGPEEPENFAYCQAPSNLFLAQVEQRMRAKPWMFQTRLYRGSIVGHAGFSKARFTGGWEELTIRLDVDVDGEHGPVFRSMFRMINDYNNFDPENLHEAPAASEEIYEKELRKVVVEACKVACSSSGGTPSAKDSSSVDCSNQHSASHPANSSPR